MKQTEYITALTRAKQSAIVDRWMPLANGAELEDVHKCSFCFVRDLCETDCFVCPLFDGKYPCCREWRTWFKQGRMIKDALAMLARIEAIDVEAWANHLVEIGVLTDEHTT